MKVSVESLGILKKAEFEVGDLTIICGGNNTGKTYATYALYGFLKFWHEGYEYDFIENEDIDKLLKDGMVQIDIENHIEKLSGIFNDASAIYSHNLPMVFGAADNSFQSAKFIITSNWDNAKYYNMNMTAEILGTNRKPAISIFKELGKGYIVLTLHVKVEDEDLNMAVVHSLRAAINMFIYEMVFKNIFPEPFIASIERTGAATFQRELDITRNQLLEKLGNSDKNSDIYSQLKEARYDRRYALPVKDDVDFNRSLQDVVKYDSEFIKNHLDIIKSFGSILNGSYKVTREGLYFVPDKGKARLTMAESASSVRSLLNLGIYLRHMAKPGDFLIIDEPELNLHPSNQRKMARLLVKIVNAGVKVFITTHSDYIIKEINTLMLLKSGIKNPQSFAKHVMEKYGYTDNEMLDFNQLKIYAARKNLVSVAESTKRKRVDTLVPLTIGEHGVEINEMDETINTMNEIQDLLLYERTEK